MTNSAARLLEKIAPAIFVVLWSTGFIGAKLGLPYAEAFTFLALRFAIAFAILMPIVVFFGNRNFRPVLLLHSMVSGFFVHFVYLGGVFFAIDRGMSAGVSSLVVALQPLLTALIAWKMLGERITGRQIAGLVAALFGVVLVLLPRLGGGEAIGGLTLSNMAAVGLSVLGISFGAVYQKRFASDIGIRASTAAQFLGALLPLSLLALLFETREIEWTGEFVFALFWLVFVLSLGAVALLMFLIRRDSASGTASMFYLVPVSTVIIAWFLFDERLQAIQMIGMVIVVAALAFATGKGASSKIRNRT